MIKKLNDKKHILIFVSLCWILYFTSYLTRLSYGASIAEIIVAKGITKTTAGFISTGGFVSYGLGQIFSGFLGDKYSPRHVIFWGLLSTSAANLAMPFIDAPKLMILVWVFNGFAQAMLWPPLLKSMSGYLKKEAFSKACIHISASSSSGAIAIYLLVPLCIVNSGWQTVFYLVSFFGIIVSVIWFLGMKYIEKYAQLNGADYADPAAEVNKESENSSLVKLFSASGMITIMAAIALQGFLKDGVTTWMPTYISEVYNLGNTISILSTVLLPLFSIISVSIASNINSKLIKNEVVSAAVMFGAGFVSSIIIIPLYSSSVAVSVIMASVMTGCMHGVNLMLITYVPAHFVKYGRVSTVSGILNAFTYLGSAISTYAFAALAEGFGWGFTIASWSVIALLGTLFAIFSIKKWNSFVTRA